MTAERRSAAGRDRFDRAPLDAPQMSGVRSFVSLAVTAEDIGQLASAPAAIAASFNPHMSQPAQPLV